MSGRNARMVAVAIGIFALGSAAGWFLSQQFDAPPFENVREDNSGYSFIKPLLFVKVPEEEAFPKYSPLKREIERYTAQAQQSDAIETVSIYFRNLDTSQWVAANAEERFSPASMLKVAVLIDILRASERDPQILARSVRLQGDTEVTEEPYPPANPVVLGSTYSVRELLEHTIIESDNVATYALLHLIRAEDADKTFDDLELPRPTSSDQTYTAQEYSRFFRALYNGTYLDRDASEYALSLLSKADFTQGIVAGVPEGTAVAHKFGVRSMATEDGIAYHELHDCGIVYHPQTPYFLCVMTRGTTLSELEPVLAGASRVVWEEVERVK